MPEQLTSPPHRTHTREGRPPVLPVVRQVVVVLLVFAVAGVVAGFVWEWLWTAPRGVVVGHEWLQDEKGLRGDFAGTGTFVAIGAVAGLLVGAAVSVVFGRAELATLVAVVVGSCLAGWLMYRVGLWLGPADPQVLARSAKDGTRLPGELLVSGLSPFAAFPSGALVGLVVVFFGLSGRGRHEG